MIHVQKGDLPEALPQDHNHRVHELVILGHVEHPYVMGEGCVGGVQRVPVESVAVSVSCFVENPAEYIKAGQNGHGVVKEEHLLGVSEGIDEVVFQIAEHHREQQIVEEGEHHVFRMTNDKIVRAQNGPLHSVCLILSLMYNVLSF